MPFFDTPSSSGAITEYIFVAYKSAKNKPSAISTSLYFDFVFLGKPGNLLPSTWFLKTRKDKQ
jgi:hypothetical protein